MCWDTQYLLSFLRIFVSFFSAFKPFGQFYQILSWSRALSMRLLHLLIKIMKNKRSLLIHYKREVAEQLQPFFRYQTMQSLNIKPQEARIINFAAYTDAIIDQNHASNSFRLWFSPASTDGSKQPQ